ncbi:unnamed protein product [Didymodactylos carnosus]|uniref:MATH domain-containing protein n=1 Tax=Didymodactylos carnosus TaxID=1234261 RepID=A0A8S2FGZ3_9BILA|nr:unnamed protein product [Didymodactylos carnosus]CAF4256548.1 unnamed protein product [Didymodactylos carnosus]
MSRVGSGTGANSISYRAQSIEKAAVYSNIRILCIPESNLHQHYLTELHRRCLMVYIHHHILRIHSPINETNSELYSKVIDNLNEKNNQMYETLKILTSGIETLITDSTSLNNGYLQLKSSVDVYREEHLKLRKSEEEKNALISAVQLNQEILQQSLTDLKQTVENVEHISYNGTFIWRLENIAQHMADALSDKQLSLYSPPFYSSPTGYKMCMRIHLGGDGHARKSHISLFFVLMKGEYDAKLPFVCSINPNNGDILSSHFDLMLVQRHFTFP